MHRPTLALIEGGLPETVTVRAGELDELRLEALQARAERLVAAQNARKAARSAMAHLRTGHLAACATSLVELAKIAESEASRAIGMSVPALEPVATAPDDQVVAA
ncbi:hypothetical protein BH23CHL8_BH23CHL8_18970 [soil metagenome]